MKFLTFLFSGPLQSWGDSARWDNRTTSSMPTKSAIVGFMGCCLGYGRTDGRLQELSRELHIAVRADRRGQLLWDFQTVQNPGGKLINSMGKPRSETIVTPKQYLQDAAFQIFVFGSDDVLERCEQAMKNPKWSVCLGRRACPPAIPILPHIVEYDTVNEALERYFDPGISERTEYMACQIDDVPGVAGDRLITRMDEPVRADINQYQERTVWTRMVKRSEKDVSQ